MSTENSHLNPGESKYQYVFTVFTPSYNRAHTLHRVYESLKAQTYRDFEWLIVDDASKDNTREVVEQWQQEKIIPIRYIYQEHGHKHIAFARGAKEADGELFLTFDSDDICDSNALERFKYHWDTIPQYQKANFSGVTCLCKTTDGRIVGSRFPADPTDSDALEINYRFKVTGEKWGFHRTDVLRGLSFYEEFRGIYMSEDLYWHQIARKYKTRFVNEALRTYFTDHVSMMNERPSKMAFGLKTYYLSVLNDEIQWFRFDPMKFLRLAVHYVRFSFHAGDSAIRQLTKIKTRLGKLLWLIAFPLGSLVYIKDRILYRNK